MNIWKKGIIVTEPVAAFPIVKLFNDLNGIYASDEDYSYEYEYEEDKDPLNLNSLFIGSDRQWYYLDGAAHVQLSGIYRVLPDGKREYLSQVCAFERAAETGWNSEPGATRPEWYVGALLKALEEQRIFITSGDLCTGGRVSEMYDNLNAQLSESGRDSAETSGWEMIQDLPGHTSRRVSVSVSVEIDRVKEDDDDDDDEYVGNWKYYIRSLDIVLEPVITG